MHEPYCKKRVPGATAEAVAGVGSGAGQEQKSAAESPKVDLGALPAGMPVEVLTIAIACFFDSVAARGGDYWRLTSQEAQSLAKVWKAVLDYYWPKAGPFSAALATTMLICGPRMLYYGLTREGRQGGSNGSGKGGERQDNTLAASAA